MHIAGKIALITGGTGGLGKAFAKALLNAEAAAVCLVDINKNGRQTAIELSQKFPPHQTVEFYQCDVTNYNRFKGAFDFVKDRFGGVDIVCNNAGITCLDSDLERTIQALRINLEAVYFGTKLGQEYMDKDEGRGGGVIINIGSMAAFVPIANSMGYSSSKAGVVALTRCAAAPPTFEMYGVRVNCLCPSFTETPIIDTIPGSREVIASIPGHFILDPDFVAKGFMQLIEDDSLNGAVMRVTPQHGIDFYKKSVENAFSVLNSKL